MAEPAAALPALPPGMGWVQDEAHGWVAVPLSAPAAPRQPARVARGPVVRAPGGQGNVVPIRPRTSQLVRPLIGGETPYEDFLDGVPDLAPGMPGSHLVEGLAPGEAEAAEFIEVPSALTAGTRVTEDVSADAWGGRAAPLRSVGVTDLKPGGGGGGGSGEAA